MAMNEKLRLKYADYAIVFQEVPNEVTLALNVSGCPYHCAGCHSKYLWDYVGRDMLADLPYLLAKYAGLITCVCFMGGDQNSDDLRAALKCVKGFSAKLKTCLYTGSDCVEEMKIYFPALDYLKVGHYCQEKGGLNAATTNQRFYRVVGGKLIDETALFQVS